MIFNSFNFIVLFPLIFLGYYLIPSKYNSVRKIFLLLVSYLLYLSFKPVYALILLGVTLITYTFALAIDKHKNATGGGTKLLIYSGISLSILPLIAFKYYNFLNDSLSSLLSNIGLSFSLPGLNWAIPVGISFFTFQAIGYLWDVYYKKIEAEKNFLDYALFVSFFPSIVSGPINKYSSLMPQIKAQRAYFDYSKAVEGCKALLWGMFIKVVVADRLGLYVDTVYAHWEHYSGLTCIFASLLYSIQIYTDFAGYSLMALGVGKILGFDLINNFNRPYFATSITNFWHRWHISLSTWLKDYIYIPMGGSRCSKVRSYWNILVTFLVSGIWHGANWTYIFWGLLHGIFQIIEKILGLQKYEKGGLYKATRIIFTFFLVNLTWIFFRMPSIGDAVNIIGKMCTDWSNLSLFTDTNTQFLLMMVGVLFVITKDIISEFRPNLKLWQYKGVRTLTYFILLVMIVLVGVLDSGQFIYVSF